MFHQRNRSRVAVASMKQPAVMVDVFHVPICAMARMIGVMAVTKAVDVSIEYSALKWIVLISLSDNDLCLAAGGSGKIIVTFSFLLAEGRTSSQISRYLHLSSNKIDVCHINHFCLCSAIASHVASH